MAENCVGMFEIKFLPGLDLIETAPGNIHHDNLLPSLTNSNSNGHLGISVTCLHPYVILDIVYKTCNGAFLFLRYRAIVIYR